MFLDGVLKYTASGYQVGVTIPSGGIARIGQQQKTPGGDHSSSKSYRGQFAKMNMWSTVLHGSAIVALLRSPGAENGDVISWKDMRTALINGNVMVQQVADMQLIGKKGSKCDRPIKRESCLRLSNKAKTKRPNKTAA